MKKIGLQVLDENGNKLLDTTEWLCRCIGRVHISIYQDAFSPRYITVEGLQEGETIWAVAMGEFMFARVEGNRIYYGFDVGHNDLTAGTTYDQSFELSRWRYRQTLANGFKRKDSPYVFEGIIIYGAY